MPGQPTRHPPGSPSKIEVLAERFARGEPLFHQNDARLPKSQGYRPGFYDNGKVQDVFVEALIESISGEWPARDGTRVIETAAKPMGRRRTTQERVRALKSWVRDFEAFRRRRERVRARQDRSGRS